MIKLVAETSLLTRGPNTASERVNIFLQVRNDQRKDVGHNPLIHHQGHTTTLVTGSPDSKSQNKTVLYNMV